VAEEFAASGKERLWVVLSHDEYGSTMLDLLESRLERGPTWTPEGGIVVTRFSSPSNDSGARGDGRHLASGTSHGRDSDRRGSR